MNLIINNNTQCVDIVQLETYFNSLIAQFDRLYSLEIIIESKEDHQIKEMDGLKEPTDENDPRFKALIDRTNKDLL